MKRLESLMQQVEFSLRKFYEDHSIEEPINLDADNAIAILLYILVQSEQHFLAQLNIIEQFINKDGVNGSQGYCLATLRVCM